MLQVWQNSIKKKLGWLPHPLDCRCLFSKYSNGHKSDIFSISFSQDFFRNGRKVRLKSEFLIIRWWSHSSWMWKPAECPLHRQKHTCSSDVKTVRSEEVRRLQRCEKENRPGICGTWQIRHGISTSAMGSQSGFKTWHPRTKTTESPDNFRLLQLSDNIREIKHASQNKNWSKLLVTIRLAALAH